MTGDIRIQKAFDLTQGILAWYYDDEKDQDQFERNRKDFVDGINEKIVKANNQRMTADITGLMESVQRTAEMYCFGNLKTTRGRKPNRKEYEAEWRRYVPESSIPPRYELVEARLGYRNE